MNKPVLKKTPQLKDFQQFILDQEKERKYSTDMFHYCLMLGEEFGELFKTIRKHEGHPIDHNSQVGSIDEELADVFTFLCAIANKYNIDLEKAFRDKWKVNENRKWGK